MFGASRGPRPSVNGPGHPPGSTTGPEQEGLVGVIFGSNVLLDSFVSGSQQGA